MTFPALAVAESTRLAELEAVVERGLNTFVEVGQALLEIRDSRLYRESHLSFEEYCRDRWQISKPHATRLIQASQVVAAVPIGTAPANEAQARELVPLLPEPEDLREIWAEIVEAHEEPTAAIVRDVVQSRMGVHYSSATDLWATPQDLFDQLDAEFGFTLDVCATSQNAKCAAFYDAELDGLSQPWSGICWMNPPYGDVIPQWIAKAHDAANAGATVVCLVPARVDTGWWWDHCRFAEIRFLRGRLKFGGGDSSAPFPSAVVIFGREPGVVWWER